MIRHRASGSHMMELNKIYCGDCIEIMKDFPDQSIDLIVTDPPYGLKIGGSGSIGGNGYVEATDYGRIHWDNHGLTDNQWSEIKRISRNQIVFGYNYKTDLFGNCRSLIIWDKKCQNDWNDNFSDCEIAFSSFKRPARIIRHLWVGALRASEINKGDRKHPTQKPTFIMKWIIAQHSKKNQIICDPFCGSGSTLQAAKELGRNFIGIEINPEYCKIAEKRLAQMEIF